VFVARILELLIAGLCVDLLSADRGLRFRMSLRFVAQVPKVTFFMFVSQMSFCKLFSLIHLCGQKKCLKRTVLLLLRPHFGFVRDDPVLKHDDEVSIL
jgi:hypothetical protein